MKNESEDFYEDVYEKVSKLKGRLVYVKVGLDDEYAVKGYLDKLGKNYLMLDIGYPELFEVPADYICDVIDMGEDRR